MSGLTARTCSGPEPDAFERAGAVVFQKHVALFHQREHDVARLLAA